MKKICSIFLLFIISNYSINNNPENPARNFLNYYGLQVPVTYEKLASFGVLKNNFVMDFTVLSRLEKICPESVSILREKVLDKSTTYNMFKLASEEFKHKLREEYLKIRYEENKQTVLVCIECLNEYMNCMAGITERIDNYEAELKKRREYGE
jgi:hypothetical protein